MKLLEENTGEKLLDISLSNNFFGYDTEKQKQRKEKSSCETTEN